MTYDEMREKAKELRRMTLEQIAYLGVGHIGGSFSIMEALVVIYYKYLHFDVKNPRMKNRDRFVLSKGHAGPALYSVLADKGFFPKEALKTLNAPDTILPSHADRVLTPGVDMTTGPLGTGFSAAVGMALGVEAQKLGSYVYALIGDGETNEGQIWEAAMAAAQYKLNRFIALLDYNKLQIDGFNRDIMNVEDLNTKWMGFGFFVQRIDGHDVEALDLALGRAKKETCRPSIIIMDTIKGKGLVGMEGKIGVHNLAMTQEEAKKWLDAL